MSKGKLIIFIKNPKKGKVKTRLAATIGEDRALEIYHILLDHTREITKILPQEKLLYYSDSIDEKDNWDSTVYIKKKQKGRDLGKRMKSAFQESLKTTKVRFALSAATAMNSTLRSCNRHSIILILTIW